ncbi:MAG: hypothetical protein PWP24_1809 [Clostridiales bacterium]|nr:hypothetical protein [Clostridiales bacterium]
MSNYPSNFAKLILEICEEEAIRCVPLSDYWAFHLSRAKQSVSIYGYQFPINQASAASICSDKSTASEILTKHSIPCVLHTCFMSPLYPDYLPARGNWVKIEELLLKHTAIVLKDNQGTGGDLVYQVKTQKEAEYASQIIFSKASTMAACPYYPIEEEYRVIVLNGQVKLIYSKLRPTLIGDGFSTILELLTKAISNNMLSPDALHYVREIDPSLVLEENATLPLHWKHNLGQGASAHIVENDTLFEALGALALAAANCLSISFASIDIIATEQSYLILEVNSGVMMEHFSDENETHRTIAKEIYREAILASFQPN